MVAVALAIVAAAVLVYVFHPRFETVLSGSMRPGIQPGDVAIVRPVPVDQIQVGDVIAYLPPKQTLPVLHRVVDINAQGLITKGDANDVADPWGRVAPKDGTVGLLVMTVPKLGYLARNHLELLIGGGLLLLAAIGLTLFSRGRKSEGAATPDETPCDDEVPVDAAAHGEPPESASPVHIDHHHDTTQPTER